MSPRVTGLDSAYSTGRDLTPRTGGKTRREIVAPADVAEADEPEVMASFRVPASLWREVKKRAVDEGTSVQVIGREALRRYLG
jgi:hypothetical protein